MLLAILLLSIFLWYEARLTYPILDPRLFLRAGVRAGALGIIALFFALFGLFYINAQYLQDIKGYSPLLSGICILPVAIVMPYVSAQSTKLAARFGARSTIIIGLLTLAAAMMLLSFSTAATPYPLYGLLLALVGVGMGLAMPPLSGTIVHALPPDKAGVSSGLNSTTREFGSALGVAVLSTVLTVRFADYLPAALQNVPGAQGEAIKHSITSALQYAASYPNAVVREQLLRGTRDAFTSATSIGLRVGVVLLLLTTVVIALQHPKE
jgi:predicted MFS family arabinose efflux permease